MKRFLVLLVVTALILAGCGGGGGNSGSNNNNNNNNVAPAPVEPEVKGTVHDFGRFSVLVPEGWSVADLGEYQTEFNGALVKGTPDQFRKAPSVSIQYTLPVELVISGRTFYEDTISLKPIETESFVYDLWEGKWQGNFVSAAESQQPNDLGVITVYSNQVTAESEYVRIDDPDITAMIKSIAVEPTTEVEWITFKDGKGIATLPEAKEGLRWHDSGYMYSNDVEADSEFEGNTVTITAESGNGVFSQNCMLTNEDETYAYGEAEFAVRITDGKVDATYNGVYRIYDEPKSLDYETEDTTDYEWYGQVYTGTWADKKNDLTMFIQPHEGIEHGYQITIQGSSVQCSTVAQIEQGGVMWYYDMSIKGESVETMGYFQLDGDMLIWGHDDETIKFENATIFSKLD